MKDRFIKSRADSLISSPQYKHICLFYDTKKELLNLLAYYFRVGLQKNEYCMCVVSAPLDVSTTKKFLERKIDNFNEHVKRGQFEIADYKKWYLQRGELNPEKVLQRWLKKKEKIQKRNFDKMRMAGNAGRLRKANFEKLLEYEKTVNDNIDQYDIIALCAYPRNKLSLDDIFRVSSNHHFSFTYSKEIVEYF